MKATKIRNQQIFRAPYAVLSNNIGCLLSNELRKKYGKRSIRVVENDSVRVIRGEYKGIDGKVTKISLRKKGIAIEGIKKEKLKGEKIDVFINASNVIITGINSDDHWRKTKLEGKKPKSTPKETKPEKAKETKPEKAKETKPEKAKETKPEKAKETKPEKAKETKPEKAKETKPEKAKETKPEKAKETKPKQENKSKTGKEKK